MEGIDREVLKREVIEGQHHWYGHVQDVSHVPFGTYMASGPSCIVTLAIIVVFAPVLFALFPFLIFPAMIYLIYKKLVKDLEDAQSR